MIIQQIHVLACTLYVLINRCYSHVMYIISLNSNKTSTSLQLLKRLSLGFVYITNIKWTLPHVEPQYCPVESSQPITLHWLYWNSAQKYLYIFSSNICIKQKCTKSHVKYELSLLTDTARGGGTLGVVCPPTRPGGAALGVVCPPTRPMLNSGWNICWFSQQWSDVNQRLFQKWWKCKIITKSSSCVSRIKHGVSRISPSNVAKYYSKILR